MQTTKTAAMILGLAAALGSLRADEAQAAYGTVKFRNTSNVAIHYQFKWAEDSDWKSSCVYPGQWQCHYIELDEDGRAPIPYIRFDFIAGDGDTNPLAAAAEPGEPRRRQARSGAAGGGAPDQPAAGHCVLP